MASYSGSRGRSHFSTNQWNDRGRAGSRYDSYHSDYEDDSQYDRYQHRASSSSVNGVHSSNVSQYSSGYRSDTCDYRRVNKSQQNRNMQDVHNNSSDRYVYSRPPLYSGNTNPSFSSSNDWHYRTRSASNSRQQQSQSSTSKKNPQLITISYDEFDDHYDDHVKIIDEQSFNGYRTTNGSLSSSSPVIRHSYSYCSHASSNHSVHIDLTCATMTIDGDELENVEKIDLVNVVDDDDYDDDDDDDDEDDNDDDDDDDEDDCSCTLTNGKNININHNNALAGAPEIKETVTQDENRRMSNHSKTKNFPEEEFKSSKSYYVPSSEIIDFAEFCLLEDSYPSMPSLTHENVNTEKRIGNVNSASKEVDNNDNVSEQPELDDEEETSESRILEADESFVTDSYVGESTGSSAEIDEEAFAENIDTAASMDIEDDDTMTKEDDQSYISNDKMSLILKRLLDDEEEEDEYDESNESFDKVTMYRKNINDNNHGNFRNKLSTIHSYSDHTGTTSDERSDNNCVDSASDTAIAPNSHNHHINEQHTIVSDCGIPDEVLENNLLHDEILVYDRDPWYPITNEKDSQVPLGTNSITIVVDGTQLSQSGISLETPQLDNQNDARNFEEEEDDGEEEEENVDDESHSSTVSSINLKASLHKTITKNYSNKALLIPEVQIESKVPTDVSTPVSTIHRSTSTLSDDSMDMDDEDDEESEYEDIDDEESVSNYDSNCATPAPHTRDLLIEAQQFKLERQVLNETINRLKQMVSVKNDDLEILGDQLRRAVMTQCELVMASAELEELKSSQAMMMVEASMTDEARQQQQNIQELKKQNYTLLEDYSIKEKELLTEIITLSNKLKDYDTITNDKIEEIERKHRNEILEKDFLIAQLTVELQTSKMKYQSLKEQSKTKVTVDENNDGTKQQQQKQQKVKSKHKVKVKTNIKKIFHTQW